MADRKTPPPASHDEAHGDNPIQDFIFARELSEVYLLLDNVTTSADKSLPERMAALDARGETATDWIKKICEIGWPPDGTPPEQAEQAASLIKIRDRLNTLAAPASGATIAFTLLVAGEDDGTDRMAPRNGLARLGAFFTGSKRAAAPLPSPHTWATDAPSRHSLASLAFPGLVPHAARFRRLMSAVLIGLFVWLVITCLLSWDVAAGSSILTRLNNATTQWETVQKQIADTEAGDDRNDTSGDGHQAAAAAAAAPTAGAHDQKPVYRYCERHLALPPVVGPDGKPITGPDGKPLERFDNVTEMRLCDQERRALQQLRIAQDGVGQWLHGWRLVLPLLAHKGTVGSVAPPSVYADRSLPTVEVDHDLQWASILAAVLASAVLPVAYGILGAGAAVLRGLSRKMKESTLSPRDLQLSLVQLALGAVIGACIGLFVTPSTGTTPAASAATTQGLIGSLPLSASALCFIAGFGVEQVFLALEALMGRVFNVTGPVKKP